LCSQEHKCVGNDGIEPTNEQNKDLTTTTAMIVMICNGTDAALSVSLEAEATSAVIAAQALSPVQGCQISPAPSSSTATDDIHLHCGCRWSPGTSRSTVVDVESTALPASLYHAHGLALPNLQTGALRPTSVG